MAQDRDQFLSAAELSLDASFLKADESESPRSNENFPECRARGSETSDNCNERLETGGRKYAMHVKNEDPSALIGNTSGSSVSLNYYAANSSLHDEMDSSERTMMNMAESSKSAVINGRIIQCDRKRNPLSDESHALDADDVSTKEARAGDPSTRTYGRAGVPSVIIDKLQEECSTEMVNSQARSYANDGTCCGLKRIKDPEMRMARSQNELDRRLDLEPIIDSPILIKIEDCFSPSQILNCSSPSNTKATVISTTGIGTSLIADKLPHLEPPAPPPSPTSDSALVDDKQKLHVRKMSPQRLSRSGYKIGSLSDNSLERSANKEALIERKQMQERLRNWKRTNKIITHIRENPFNMHMDCLEQLNSKASADCRVDYNMPPEHVEAQPKASAGSQQQTPWQHQQLHSYATHLSHLYRKNQAMMDNNSDFRTLLYNIICCLLTQDEQILSTPSVTKMIDVIRTHLESASKFYSAASLSFNNPNNTQNNLLASHTAPKGPSNDMNRKSSLGSLSLTSSSSSTFNTMAPTAGPSTPGLTPPVDNPPASAQLTQTKKELHHLHPDCSPERRPKPADFRRISSVSYNDEQLINDLCCGAQTSAGSRSVSDIAVKSHDSPWKYDELSFECKHSSHHHTSQSSLENNSSAMEIMHDSGIGTVYDFQFEEFLVKGGARGGTRKRHSDVSEFKPKQQPSYISTDDYLSQLPDESNRTSYYDDESNSALQRRDLQDNRPVDVASRRAELEWTLNKLINFEVKYTWLTCNDTLRRAIRKIGVPNEIRGKVWMILIEQLIGAKYETEKLLEKAGETIAQEEALAGDEEIQSILKQIDLDVNRTMPGHKLFDDGAEGGIKLRRILVAYSVHINRAIAYCQGFNFIVALLLSVFEGDEDKALRGFVCIVDHIFPSKFYFDHYLTGARADQFLLADFICDQLIKNPTSAERKMVEGVTSSITLNWFISLFHGAVPTLTRLTILDHFMLDGVKALFRFTMAILYLAFEVTPPSSCEVFTTIRNTAKDMYDIKLLLSIVEQIKLPKDSYFAIRRSFYMVQSSFNSDQFYMQSLSNDTSRQLVANKPLSVQNLPDTKPPAMSLILGASSASQHPFGLNSGNQNFHNIYSNRGLCGPRICTSADRTKVCIQNIGKLGRSHIKIMDTNVRSNERSLMSPLRNCLVIGISNCGKNIIVARQSSKRNYKTFHEQDLQFSVHELSAEIFDGFYLEDCKLAVISTHVGEIFKIDVSKCFADSQVGSTETITLRDSHSIGEHEKLKLRLISIDMLTNLLWIYVECEDTTSNVAVQNQVRKSIDGQENSTTASGTRSLYRNNPFIYDDDEAPQYGVDSPSRSSHLRKILIIDIITFDIFSAFTLHQSFGDIMSMRTSLVAFCQLANPMSNQFSSRIVRIGPTGHYEHLLSFSDVVDFLISVPELHKNETKESHSSQNKKTQPASQRYASIKKLLPRSISLHHDDSNNESNSDMNKPDSIGSGTLTKYYRSLVRRHSIINNVLEHQEPCKDDEPLSRLPEGSYAQNGQISQPQTVTNGNTLRCTGNRPCRGIVTSYLGDVEDSTDSNYTPVNMVFIFRNGKIALFEFTESYAIHTRESQLERYDYSKVIDVTKNGEDFVVTILTIFDKLIKVVI